MLLTLFLILTTSLNVNSDLPMKKHAPYGLWKSSIHAQTVAQQSIRFTDVSLQNGVVYWLECRPNENGRYVLMAWSDLDGEQELLPKEYSVRSRVHEYGGGALLIGKNALYFINDSDQQIYSRSKEGIIRKITSCPACRFADGSVNEEETILYYVMEDHGSSSVENSIVKIDIETGKVQLISKGNDFYSCPRISKDGQSLAYISWDHPNMPWDHTKLWIHHLQNGRKDHIAGFVEESVTDLLWHGHQLYYISDRSNYWNIYSQSSSKPFLNIDADCALPQWTFSQSLYGISNQGIVSAYIERGSQKLCIHENNNTIQLPLEYTSVKKVVVEGDIIAFIGCSPAKPSSIITYQISTGKERVIKSACSHQEYADYISIPKEIAFPTENGKTAYAFYYPPTNPHFHSTHGEAPPLIVNSHGGPTAHFAPCFSPEILYWTSRGYAILDVNYGGSTGYGKEYRNRLKGNWGIVDVDDCIHGALYCVDIGLADPNRLAIQGGSAGGYTTLAALAFRSVFKVGADYFGVSDLERLAQDTHKFESRYLEQLIGPYPETQSTYFERSPIHRADNISCPVIIFQGDEDKVVPPSQSEIMYQSLLKRGIPTAYFLFKGEQHGFRKSENIQKALEEQLLFFSKVLNLMDQ